MGVLAVAVLMAGGLTGCGDDGAGGGAGGGDSADGPANEVSASVEGGESAGSVEGASEESEQGLYHGAVLGGQLIVSLASGQGDVLFFELDTAFGQAPGGFRASRQSDGAAFLTYTTASGTPAIYESNGGQITVDQCPNEADSIVTGSFDDVALINSLTEGDGGVLNGQWRVVVVSSDGSADCVPEPEDNNDANNDVNNGGDDGGNNDSGGACENDTCDGPCCPYLPALESCVQGCFSDECLGFDAQLCADCLDGCYEESGMLGDPACATPLEALLECSEANQCDDGDASGEACVAENCCEEDQAAF